MTRYCLDYENIGLSLQLSRGYFSEMDLLVLPNSLHMKPEDA